MAKKTPRKFTASGDAPASPGASPRRPSTAGRRGPVAGPKLPPAPDLDLEAQLRRLSTDVGIRRELVANMSRLLGEAVSRDQIQAIAEYRQHLKMLSDLRRESELEERVQDLEARLVRDTELASQRQGSALRSDLAPAPRNGRDREKN